MSLTILAGMVAIIIPWVQTAAALHDRVAPQQVWNVSAEHFFEMLGDDLAIGDFPQLDDVLQSKRVTQSQENQTDGNSHQVVTGEDGRVLRIRTRLNPLTDQPDGLTPQNHPGPVVREYRFNKELHTMTMQLREFGLQFAQPLRQPGRVLSSKRILLNKVADWSCSISHDPESDTESSNTFNFAVLKITLTRMDGTQVVRRFMVES